LELSVSRALTMVGRLRCNNPVPPSRAGDQITVIDLSKNQHWLERWAAATRHTFVRHRSISSSLPAN
jgi:hypothetical protein